MSSETGDEPRERSRRVSWLSILELSLSVRNQYTFLFFGVLLAYLLTASYTGQNSDTASAFYPAWQLAHHSNLTMDGFPDRGLWLVEAQDRLVSNRFPGVIWYATPFYLLDQVSRPTPAMANLAAATAAAGALVILLGVLRRLVSARTAAAAVLVVALATPMWTVSGDALWTHGPGALCLLAGVLLYASHRPAWAGVAFGAAVTIRPHYAVIPAAVGLLDVFASRRIGAAARIAAGATAGLVLVVLYNMHVFGAPVASGYEYGAVSLDASGLVAMAERIAGTLFSPSRGVFVLTPFLLLLIPGLPKAWRAAPPWVRYAAIGSTLYMLVQLTLNRYSGGHNFYSYRLPIEWLTLCSPLLVLAYSTWTRERVVLRHAFFFLVVYSGATHAMGALLFEQPRLSMDPWRTWDVGGIAADRPVESLLVALLATVVAAAASLTLSPGMVADRGAEAQRAEGHVVTQRPVHAPSDVGGPVGVKLDQDGASTMFNADP